MKVTKRSIKNLEKVIAKLEAWQHRPDVIKSEAYMHVSSAKSELIRVLRNLED